MRMTASWCQGLNELTAYKFVGRAACAHMKRAPLDIVIPTTISMSPCSERSRCGLAKAEQSHGSARRPTLTAPARADMSNALGRGGETSFKSNKETDDGKKKDATLQN
jgi:hypothetical protein